MTDGGVTAEETVARIEGLQSALGVASDRLDRVAVAEAEAVLRRSRERLRLSAGHTVVTLAGATGSGKSSLFNALTGLDLAGVGAKRPTTSWATACAWDPLGAADLLDWLGVPARHQVSRLSMLDATAEDNELRGLVLLDLPDHDSTEVAHHLEVDRLVQHADLLVWVLDPQKYADAALHERYLRPYAGHSHVMLILLNQVDRLDEVERTRTIANVRQLLDDDGLPDVALLAVSATEGIGITEFKTLLIQQVKQKQVARERVAADVSAVAGRLADAGGAAAAQASASPDAEAAREFLVDECTAASGADLGAADGPSRAGSRARALAGWPPLIPVRTGALRRSVPGGGSALPDRSRLKVAATTYADTVSDGLPAPWVRAVRSAVDGSGRRLTAALTHVASRRGQTLIPILPAVVLQLGLLVAAAAAIYWQLTAEPDGRRGFISAAVALGLGLALDPVLGGWASRRAATSAEGAAGALRQRVAAVADEEVVRPVAAELGAYAECQRGLDAAQAS